MKTLQFGKFLKYTRILPTKAQELYLKGHLCHPDAVAITHHMRHPCAVLVLLTAGRHEWICSAVLLKFVDRRTCGRVAAEALSYKPGGRKLETR